MIVLDANLAAKAVIPGSLLGEEILERLAVWHKDRVRLLAPDIWLPEVISVVRQAIFLNMIAPGDGIIVVEDVFRLGVEVIPSDLELCQSALAWAGRLGQSKAYDSFYLALSQRLGAELWTGDLRLFQRARQLGVDWVRSLSEGIS